MELQERVGSDEDEVDEERQLVLRHVTTSVARSIETGKIGAVAFQQRKGESTVILTAHRLSTVRHADRIALLEDGQLVALGDQLLRWLFKFGLLQLLG